MNDRDYLQVSIKDTLAALIACVEDKEGRVYYNQLIDEIMAGHKETSCL